VGDRKKYAKTQLTRIGLHVILCGLEIRYTVTSIQFLPILCQISVKVRFVVFKRNVLKTVDYVLNSLQGGTAILVYVLKFAQFPGTLPSMLSPCLATKV